MSRDEALALLALDARATDGEVTRAFESAYNLLRTQIDHAPNARLQEAIGEQLRRVEQAHAALRGASGAAAYDDLPASAPVASPAAPPAPPPAAPAPEPVRCAATLVTPVAAPAPAPLPVNAHRDDVVRPAPDAGPALHRRRRLRFVAGNAAVVALAPLVAALGRGADADGLGAMLGGLGLCAAIVAAVGLWLAYDGIDRARGTARLGRFVLLAIPLAVVTSALVVGWVAATEGVEELGLVGSLFAGAMVTIPAYLIGACVLFALGEVAAGAVYTGAVTPARADAASRRAAPAPANPARRWLAGGGVAVALLLLALYTWPGARRGAESPDVLFARGRSAFDAREFARALPDLEAAARQGHREARYLTGELYGGGFDGVERADDRGRPWLMLAADSGHAGAMYELGERYSTGDGVARNYTSAVGWYRRAAELGHAEAQRSLGNNYITGVGIPTGPDTAEAANWYGRAADGGDAEAAFRLATLHEQGHGVARDLPRALTLYRQAIPRRTDAAGAVERVERAITRGER